jgi:hypothetical protein
MSTAASPVSSSPRTAPLAAKSLGLRPAPPGRRRLAEALLPGLLAELPRHVAAALDVGRILAA